MAKGWRTPQPPPPPTLGVTWHEIQDTHTMPRRVGALFVLTLDETGEVLASIWRKGWYGASPIYALCCGAQVLCDTEEQALRYCEQELGFGPVRKARTHFDALVDHLYPHYRGQCSGPNTVEVTRRMMARLPQPLYARVRYAVKGCTYADRVEAQRLRQMRENPKIPHLLATFTSSRLGRSVDRALGRCLRWALRTVGW